MTKLERDPMEKLATVLTMFQQHQRVVYADSGAAFKVACDNRNAPEVKEFLEKCMDGVVSIFLDQKAPNVRSNLLVNFDLVLIGAAKLIVLDFEETKRMTHLETLFKLLNHECPYYSTADTGDLGDSANKTILSNSRGARTRIQIVEFAEMHGLFEGLVSILIDRKAPPDDTPLSSEQVRLFLAPIVAAREILRVEDIQKACFAAISVIENMDEETLKLQRSTDLTKVHRLLRVCLEHDDSLKQFLRSLSLKTFTSKAFQLRKLGLDLMCKICNEASNVENQDSFSISSMNKWFVEKEVLEKLFASSESVHPALVGRSKRLLEFMARGDAIEEKHIDMMFKSCMGLHDSVRGAVQTLLAEISVDHLARPETGAYIFASASKQIETTVYCRPLAQCKPATLSAFVTLLWELLDAIRDLSSPKRATIIDYIIQVLGLSNASFLRAQYIVSFVNTLSSTKEYWKSFNAYEITPKIISLFDAEYHNNVYSGGVHLNYGGNELASDYSLDPYFVEDHPQNDDTVNTNIYSSLIIEQGSKKVRNQSELIVELETRYEILKLVVSEIEVFCGSVDYSRHNSSKNLMLKYMQQLECRLSFLQFCISRSPLMLSFDLVHQLWRTLKNPLERELCIIWLRQVAVVDVGLRPGLSTQVSDLVFSKLLCEEMDFKYMTVPGFRCYSAFFLDINKADGILDGDTMKFGSATSLRETINSSVSDAFTSSDHQIAVKKPSMMNSRAQLLSCDTGNPESTTKPTTVGDTKVTQVKHPKVRGMDTLWKIIQAAPVADRAIDLLLQIQCGIEALESDKEIDDETAFFDSPSESLKSRLEFLDHAFTFLETATPDLQLRYIQMISSYLKIFEHYGNATSHYTPNANVLDLVVHHDKVMLFSQADAGKVLQIAIPQINNMSNLRSTPLRYYSGLILNYFGGSEMHDIWLSDGRRLTVDLRPNGSSYQLTGCSQLTDGELPFKLSAGVGIDDEISLALDAYTPLTIKVGIKSPLMLLQSSVLEKLMELSENPQNTRLSMNTISLRVQLHQKGIPDFGHERVMFGSYIPLEDLLPQDSKAAKVTKSLTRTVVHHVLSVVIDEQYGEHPISRAVNPKDLPSVLITQAGSKYSVLMMGLLSSAQVSPAAQRELWEVLMKLPTDSNLKDRLQFDYESIDWQVELAWNDTCMLRSIYTLMVVNKLIGNDDEDGVDACSAWRSSFLKSNGFQEVCKLLSHILNDDSTSSFAEWQRLVALPVIVQVIRFCVDGIIAVDHHRPAAFSPNSRKILWSETNFSQIVSDLSKLIVTVFQATKQTPLTPVSVEASVEDDDGSTSVSEDDDDVYSENDILDQKPDESSFAMFEVLIEGVQTASEILEVHCDLDMVFLKTSSSLTDVLLYATFPGVRTVLGKLLFQLSDRSISCCEEIEKLSLASLKGIPVGCKTCDDFFRFIRDQLRLRKFSMQSFAELVANGLCRYPARSGLQLRKEAKLLGCFSLQLRNFNFKPRFDEVPGKQPHDNPQYMAAKKATMALLDDTLLGLLELMELILEEDCCNLFEDHTFCDSLLQNLFYRYLMAVPGVQNTKASPLATLSDSRSRVFSLLGKLANKQAYCLEWLLNETKTFVLDTPVPLTRAGGCDWSFKPTDFKKAPSGFVGLINQGATCYQNSVLQQLFMAPDLRKWICSAAGSLPNVGEMKEVDEGTESWDNCKNKLLRALQYTFTFLRNSDKRFFNPRQFVNESVYLKLMDGHLSQNDAIEFYSRLVDYLEESSASNSQCSKLQDLLYVRTCTMNIRNCDGKHRTESEVGTPFLTLNVRSGMAGPTLHSLDDALESWFKAETLSGLECEQCNTQDKERRFDADQIKCFSKLPPVLVVQLQRFDYDYETMQATKLNHRVSFERRIDLSRFTRKSVVSSVSTKTNNEFDDEEDIPTSPKNTPVQESNEYELRGVVVHQGSGANFGHYYSFISDRVSGKWFRFDDERVTLFDVRNLEDECYGGSPQDESPYDDKYKYNRGSKDNNAYLLLYERVSRPSPVSGDTGMRLTKSSTCGIRFPMSAKLVYKLKVLLRKGRLAIALKSKLAKVQNEVWEDNQRTHRHGIVMVLPFLEFAFNLVQCASKITGDISAAGCEMGLIVSLKAVIRVASLKHRLRLWLTELSGMLTQNPTLAIWFLQYLSGINTREEILEPLLVHCPDVVAREFFETLVVRSLQICLSQVDRTECSDEQRNNTVAAIMNFVQTLVDILPIGPCDCKCMGTYFNIWKALVSCERLHESIFELKVPEKLLQLYLENDETRYTNDNRHESMSCDSEFTGLLDAVSILVVGSTADDAYEENTKIDGFPGDDDILETDDFLSDFELLGSQFLPLQFSRGVRFKYNEELLGETLALHIARRDPRSGAQLVAFVCKGDSKISSSVVEQLTRGLKSRMNLFSSMIDAKTSIKGVCRCIRALSTIQDGYSHERCRNLVEDSLNVILHSNKELKDLISRRDSQRGGRYSLQLYADNDGDDMMELLTYIIYGLTKALAQMFRQCEGVRFWMVEHKKHWLPWLAEWMDERSYDICLGGNPDVYFRRKGKAVRMVAAMTRSVNPEQSLRFVQPIHVSVEVAGAGLDDCNGTYLFDGFFLQGESQQVDTVTPKFVKVENGRRITLYRCLIKDKQYTWYMSELSSKPGTSSDTDFYNSPRDNPSSMPPEGGWSTCSNGVKPAPQFVRIIRRQFLPEDKPTVFLRTDLRVPPTVPPVVIQQTQPLPVSDDDADDDADSIRVNEDYEIEDINDISDEFQDDIGSDSD